MQPTLAGDGPTRSPADAPAAVSRDALWRGRLPLWQPARRQGYRFNLDSVLLAGFAPTLPAASALELGAGCGIIGLMLLAAGKVATLTAVERQSQLVDLLRRNVAAYGWQERTRVLAGDLRQLSLPEADLVLFNPPYFGRDAGRAATEPGRDAGRRELFGTLADFVARGAACLRPRGQLLAILPYGRRHELEAALLAAGLQVVRQRAVQAEAQAPPRHILVAARRAAPCIGTGEPAAEVLTPLVVHVGGRGPGNGRYSDEVTALIEGPAAWTGPPSDAVDRWP